MPCKAFVCLSLLILTVSLNCRKNSYKYTGDVSLERSPFLKGKKVLLDAGHGGSCREDSFRTGPESLCEEEVNLRVALYLSDMLTRAGVKVMCTRVKDVNVPLADRVKLAQLFKPDLLISIHHNGSARRVERVNYPMVLIWGSREVNPASYDLASLLLGEFHRIMDERGHVTSDLAVFTETGTQLLRETRNLCPGLIGEGGFFSDERHTLHLKDLQYNQREAEAYFLAIAEYFRRGVPAGKVLISSPIKRESFQKNHLAEESPLLALRIHTGMEPESYNFLTIEASLDEIPFPCRKLSPGLYQVDYGPTLPPGVHTLRFRVVNARHQSSPYYYSVFTRDIRTGDYAGMILRGQKLIKKKKTVRQGLLLLQSALSLGRTDPRAPMIHWFLSRGYRTLNDKAASDYYLSRIYHFYPESSYAKKVPSRLRGYRFPVNHLGKEIAPIYDPSLKNYRP